MRDPTTAANGPGGATDENFLGGILGSILGETPAQQKARIEEATKGANDLSGMIKKKKKPAVAETANPDMSVAATETTTTTTTNGKRKAEDGGADDGVKSGKKVKFEDDAPTTA